MVENSQNTGYGQGNPQIQLQQPAILAQRDPLGSDRYSLTRTWLNTTNGRYWILVSYSSGNAVWNLLNNSSSIFITTTTPVVVTGNNILTELPAVTGGLSGFLMNLQFEGANVDIGSLYVVRNNGYGGTGSIALISAYQSFNNTGGAFAVNSVGMSGTGTIVANLTVPATPVYNAIVSMLPIGDILPPIT